MTYGDDDEDIATVQVGESVSTGRLKLTEACATQLGLRLLFLAFPEHRLGYSLQEIDHRDLFEPRYESKDKN